MNGAVAPQPGDEGARAARPAHPLLRPVLLGVAGLLLALLAWAVIAGLQARADLLAARALLADVDTGAGADSAEHELLLDRAGLRTARAVDRLEAPGPALVANVPLLGRSLAAGQDVAVAADALVQAARGVAPLVTALEVEGGQVDPAAVRELADEMSSTEAGVQQALARLADTRLGLTPGPVRRGVEQARDELLPAGDGLRRAAAGMRAAHGLLGSEGPRTLVIGLMNNAEARGAGGYVASFAVVQIDDGAVTVSPFRDVNEVQATPANAVPVPASQDFSRRWGRYLADTTLWKNVAMSPHVPDSASVMCEVAQLAPGVPCDAAVMLDVPALAAVMTLAGPVQIGEQQLEGDELVRALLIEAYAGAEEQGLAPSERRAELLAAADAAVADLLSSRLTGLPALRTLGELASGRHVAVWSQRPAEQADLLEAGAAGSADPDGADLSLVSLNQLSAGKLDVYLDRDIELDVVVGEEVAVVEQRIALTFDHPPGLPQYVLGVRGGRLDELVDLGLSPAAEDVSLTRDGAPVPFELVEADRGSQRAAFVLSMSSPERAEFVLRYTVPVDDGRYRLRVLPQPLASAASLRLRVRAAEGLELQEQGQPGEVLLEGPLTSVRDVEVQAVAPSWWDRPVTLPF